MKKLILTFLIFSAPFLSGCGGRELDDMAYVVAIGIDSSGEGQYGFTFAIGNPSSINGGGGENSGGGDSNVLIFESEESASIFSAGDAVGARIGQKVNFSHAELLVFSGAAAAEGVEPFFDGLTRNLNQRPKLIPVVSQTSAREALEAINSSFEGNPEKYLKKVFESRDSAISAGINSREFLCRAEGGDGGSAVPLLITGEDSVSAESMSVFDGWRMTGSFNDILSYKLLTGNGGDVSFDVAGMGTLILSQRAMPTVKVCCGEAPEIKIIMELDAAVAAIADGAGREQLRAAAENALQARLASLLEYSAREAGVDIFGFERYGRKCFLTWDAWKSYNWHSQYKKATFQPRVELRLTKTGLIKGGL